MSAPAGEPVYKQFRADEMEAHFNPRTVLPDVDGLLAERAARSAETRARLENHRNLAYGDSERQVVDIFPAAEPNAPVNLYIHGGYWRAVSKDDVSQLAEPFHAKGVTAVLLDYDLCPQVTLTDIVAQARRGVAWTWRRIADYGGDPSRVAVGGDSAGYAVGMINPRYVIPAHYGVFDTMDQTPDAFLEALKKHAPGVEAIVLEPEETAEF